MHELGHQQIYALYYRALFQLLALRPSLLGHSFANKHRQLEQIHSIMTIPSKSQVFGINRCSLQAMQPAKNVYTIF